jgi:hypothetical protein
MLNSQQLQTMTDKALNDHKFRALARKDARAALESLGVKVPAGVQVRVFENSPKAMHVVLPPKTDMKGSTIDPNVLKVFEKAWADEGFKKKLLANPADAIKNATGAQVPKTVSLTVHENGKNEFNLVLPYVPASSGELNDDDLELVAGGKGSHKTSTVAACSTAGTVSMVVGVAAGPETGGLSVAAGIIGSAVSSAVSASK